MATNPFLQQSSVGVPTPTPLFQNGGFAPAVNKMAGEYAKNAAEFGTSFLGQTGLLDSSFKERVIANAYNQGFQNSVGAFQQQQSLYNDWSNNLFQMKLAEGAQQQQPSFMQNLLGGAVGGLGIGSLFQTDKNKWMGPLVGGLVGGGLGALGLTDGLF